MEKSKKDSVTPRAGAEIQGWGDKAGHRGSPSPTARGAFRAPSVTVTSVAEISPNRPGAAE